MMWPFKFLVLYSCLLFSIHATMAQESSSSPAEKTKNKTGKAESFEQKIELLVKPYMDLESSTGLIIGILDESSVGYKVFGTVSKKDSIAPTKETLFEIGSMSKVFTALTFLLLEEEGQIKRTDPISQYISKKHLSKYLLENEILIEDLLNHRSGLPKFPFNLPFYKKSLKNPYALYDYSALEEFLKLYEPEEDQKLDFIFSHVNFALLGYILEKASKKPFADLIEEKINQQLALTSIRPLDTEQENYALAYDENGLKHPIQQYESLTPAAGLSASAEDLVKLMKLSCVEFKKGNDSAIEKSMVEIGKTHQAGVTVSPAWQVFRTGKGNNFTYTFNSGTFGGNRCFMAFVPHLERGVVVLANNKISYRNENTIDMIGIEILSILSR